VMFPEVDDRGMVRASYLCLPNDSNNRTER